MLKLVVDNTEKPKITEIEIDPGNYYPFLPKHVVRQTYAAYGVKAKLYYLPKDGHCCEKIVWFPKSQLLEWRSPGWIFIAKAKEMRDILIEHDKTMQALEDGSLQLSDFVTDIAGIRINLDANCLE